MLSSDIEEQILASLQQIFQVELIDNVSGDPMALKTLKQADLQDDPTTTAPYLVFRPDLEKGVQPVPRELEAEYGGREIGGPVRFLHYFEAQYGTPRALDRASARADLALLETRIADTLMSFYDLSGVLNIGVLTSSDYSKRLEGANPYLIDKIIPRIFGGEQEFYGNGHIYWHYPVAWYTQFRVLLPM